MIGWTTFSGQTKHTSFFLMLETLVGKWPSDFNSTRSSRWFGFTSQFIIGPYFFEENNNGIRQTVTVNGERYYSFVFPRLRNHDMENIIFMQDGAPPLQNNTLRRCLAIVSSVGTFQQSGLRDLHITIRQTFGCGVTSKNEFPWHIQQPHCNLTDAISQEIANIPRHYLQNAVHGVANRLLYVEQDNGGHIPKVL